MNKTLRLVIFLGWSVLLGGGTLLPLAAQESARPAPVITPTTGKPAGKAERVVIVVWDGLRPDSVTDEATPTLAKLAREGTTFTRHHSVYPSSTEVNGTAMATGCYPGHSGIIGNRMFIPGIDPLRSVATETVGTIRKGDEASSGKYLAVPTLAELAHAAGWRTVIAGTKNVVLLQDRAVRPEGDLATESVVLHAGDTLPPGVAKRLNEANGAPFPVTVQLPNVVADAWTTKALTGTLWNGTPPKLSVLWLSDPDFTQHQFGPDSPQAHRALASSDGNLATLLGMLDAKHWRDTTDVFVISDHGFSTVGQPSDVTNALVAAGFSATHEYKKPPQPGEVLVVGLGGSVYLYVAGHDQPTIRRLTEFFQQTAFAGVIFTNGGLPGTFGLNAVHIDSPNAPDVVVALRWNDDKSVTGFPGTMMSEGRKPGQGSHASLSRYELHNTLVANGPDFRVGFRDELPSSNIDLAPTIAHILHLPNVPPMDGRVLAEAFAEGVAMEVTKPVTQRAEATREIGNTATWRQYLQTTVYKGETYFDEGNAVVPAK